MLSCTARAQAARVQKEIQQGYQAAEVSTRTLTALEMTEACPTLPAPSERSLWSQEQAIKDAEAAKAAEEAEKSLQVHEHSLVLSLHVPADRAACRCRCRVR